MNKAAGVKYYTDFCFYDKIQRRLVVLKGELTMKKLHKIQILVMLAALGSLLLSACGPGEAALTPTFSIEAIQTLSVATFSAQLTQTALSAPTATFTNTPAATNTPLATNTAGTPFAPGGTPTASCYRLLFLKDVTVPDDTLMTPGQTFTKTWDVQNSGNCAWEAGFKFTHVGGNAMGGTTLTLASAVSPNSKTELSIPMTAPATSGTVTGSWRMSTADGAYFGDVLTVVIVLSGTTATTTAAFTSTPTETPTPP